MAEYTLPDLPYDYAHSSPMCRRRWSPAPPRQAPRCLRDRRQPDVGEVGGRPGRGRLRHDRRLGEDPGLPHLGSRAPLDLLEEPEPGRRRQAPNGALGTAIDENFGSFDKFKAHFTQATSTVQGSGWGHTGVRSAGRSPAHRAGLRPPGQRGAGSVPLLVFDAGSTPSISSTRTSRPTSSPPCGTSSTGPTWRPG